MTDQRAHPPRQWAIVELFGHQRLAGEISEQTFGGAGFVRVDVPEVSHTIEQYVAGELTCQRRTIPAHSRTIGAQAIYSINWCDEAAALMAAQGIRHEPVKPWALRDALAQLPLGDRAMLLRAPAETGDGLFDDGPM